MKIRNKQTGQIIEVTEDQLADYGLDTMAKGGMIKRADGSYSRRGLWDNIRANKGSGKKPTKAMLAQEKKIRAAEKAYGGYMDMGGYMNPYMGYVEITCSGEIPKSFCRIVCLLFRWYSLARNFCASVNGFRTLGTLIR